MVQLMKVCTKCNKEKSLDDYHKCKKGKYGRKSKCKDCRIITRKLYYNLNKELAKVQRDIWNKENPDAKHKHYLNNKEVIKKRSVTWNRNNKEKRKIIRKKWNDNNKAAKNHSTAKRRAAKLQRTSKWADIEAIKKFYEDCLKGYVVDHVYPLQGKKCSGLHTIENLQYLTQSENSSKGNKMPEEWKKQGRIK